MCKNLSTNMMNWWLLWLTLPFSALAAQEGRLEEGLVNPGYVEAPPWFKNSFLDLREDVAEASQAGKRLILYFYQDGCPYCERLIRTNFSDPRIVDKTRRNFDVVAINLWGDREVTDLQGKTMTEKQFATSLRVQFTPTLLFLDEQGRVVLRANGYYPPHKFSAALDYVSGRHEKRQSFRDYYARAEPVPASGRLHADPAYLDPARLNERTPGKPLLVLFEQKVCRACDELHLDVFRRPEVKASLDRFDVVLLDIWSDAPVVTPTGEKTTMKAWSRKLNILFTPSLVFFDAGNREVFRTEAYLRAFHLHAALDYVASGAYRDYPEFQRYVQARADRMREQGRTVDLWK